MHIEFLVLSVVLLVALLLKRKIRFYRTVGGFRVEVNRYF